MFVTICLLIVGYVMTGSLLAAVAVRLSKIVEKSSVKRLDSLDAVWITVFWPLCLLLFIATIWYSLLDKFMGKFITEEKVNQWRKRTKKEPGTGSTD